MSLQDTATAARLVRDIASQLSDKLARVQITAGLCFPTPDTLRATAAVLSDISDLADSAMRDIHDAIPDQIAPAPGPDAINPDCQVCRGTGAEDWIYLGYVPCRQCLPRALWPGERA